MQIDSGEYFVIARGYKLNDQTFKDFLGLDPKEPWQETQTETKPKEPRYDRSYNGHVYQCLETCGTQIVAKCVHAPKFREDNFGEVKYVNTDELEIMTVTPRFVELLVKGKEDIDAQNTKE